jgi:hypothetical protein
MYLIVFLNVYLLNDHIRLLNQKISNLESKMLTISMNASEKIKLLNELEKLSLDRYHAIITEDLE